MPLPLLARSIAQMSGAFHQRGGFWVVAQFVLMTLLFVATPWLRGTGGIWPLLAVGAVLFLLGGWVGVRGKRDLGSNRTPFPQPLAAAQLITTGIYAHIRHPLYASLILLGFGWALLWSSPLGFGCALAQAIFFDLKARREERLLAGKYPDYVGYSRRVRRFIPRLY